MNVRSLVLFGLVGLSNTIIDNLVFFLLYHWFSQYYLAVQAVAYACGMVNSYLLNKYWTFSAKDEAAKTITGRGEIIKFILVNLLTLSVSSSFLYVLSQSAGLNMFICKIIATVMSFAVNYSGTRFWVFKDQKITYAR